MDQARRRGGLIFETRHRRKNGRSSGRGQSRLIDIGGALYYQGILATSASARGTKPDHGRAREKEVRSGNPSPVKNICSDLESSPLQSSKFTEAEVLEAFRESRSRIKSMALVHEKLYGERLFAH
jgi:hypothetical protein